MGSVDRTLSPSRIISISRRSSSRRSGADQDLTAVSQESPEVLREVRTDRREDEHLHLDEPEYERLVHHRRSLRAPIPDIDTWTRDACLENQEEEEEEEGRREWVRWGREARRKRVNQSPDMPQEGKQGDRSGRHCCYYSLHRKEKRRSMNYYCCTSTVLVCLFMDVYGTSTAGAAVWGIFE